MILTHLVVAAALLLQASTAPKPAAQKPAAKPAAQKAGVPGELPVKLTYKGKGTVDAQHKLIAWLFTDTNVTSASRPVATTETATTNGATVTFKNVPASPVYVFAVYDETGNYDGVSGPPPKGLPYALYKKTPKGPPVAVAAGQAPIAFTFTDAERWNK